MGLTERDGRCCDIELRQLSAGDFRFSYHCFSIFLFIKLITKLTQKKAEAPAAPPAPPAPTKEEILLTEIRDLLKEKQ